MWININEETLRLIAGRMAGDCPGLALDIHKTIELYERPERPVFIEAARNIHTNDEREIDDLEVAISPSDEGCWVMGWFYVSDTDVDACERCGAIPGTPEYGTVGDGYDGLCPSCADKAENDE